MALTVIGVVFGPLLVLFAALFLFQDKGRRVCAIASGLLFLLAALYQLLQPVEPLWLHIPQILWKLLTLATAAFLFLLAIRDKHYSLSILAFIQILALTLTEILVSPDEPAVFLQPGAEEKLLFLAGAFIFAVMLPVALMRPEFQQPKKGRHTKSGYMGIFLWMAAFAGILCARSMTGLYLFAQWGYLGSLFMRKAFGEPKKGQLLPVLQQSAMTLWIVASVFIYLDRGTIAMADLAEGGFTTGLLSVVALLFVLTMGVLIPEQRISGNRFLWPSSIMGLSMILFSLLVPFSVLLKFRSIFLNLDHNLAAPAVFLGALLMAANAYYAGEARRTEELLSHLTLFVSGWGVISAYTGMEGVFFSVGYILAAAIAVAFLYICISVQKDGEQQGEAGLRCYPAGALARFMAIIPLLFLLPPFSCALPGFAIMPMMSEYGLAILVAAAGLVLMTAVLVRWVLPMLRAEKASNGEKHVSKGIYRFILPGFFIVTIVVNLLSEPIYRYLQSQPLPMGAWRAAYLENYTELSGMVHLFGLNPGSAFLGLSLILLMMLYLVTGKGFQGKGHINAEGSVTPYSLTSWLPAGFNIPLCIRAAWITSATLLVGVALSCLKG
jgi:hypothetical protein